MGYFGVSGVTELRNVKEGAKIHIIGICGVAMGQLGLALADLGYTISGSDKEFYDPMASLLKESEISLFGRYDQDNIPDDVSLVIIGNSVSADNPEVQYIERQRLNYTCFPSCLADLLVKNRFPIVVSGTHGKSTTTSLVAHILREANRSPGYFVGAKIEGLNRSLCIGSGPETVLEGDEYDSAFFAKVPKFDFYDPRILIITSIEYDHADIYPDLDSIIAVFDGLVSSRVAGDLVVLCGDDGTIKSLLPKWKSSSVARLVTYGQDVGNDWRIGNVVMDKGGTSFVLSGTETEGGSVRIPLVGAHNALNASAAIVSLLSIGLPLGDIVRHISTFKGVKRRLTELYQDQEVWVYEDFAHHPSAVSATLKSVKLANPESRVWAVFDPRSNTSRRKVFQSDYERALEIADSIIIKEVVPRHNDSTENLLNTAEIAETLRMKGKKAYSLVTVNEIIKTLLVNLSGRDVVLLMSNGSFDGLPRELVGALRTRSLGRIIHKPTPPE
jgi:UDP-N-acetylmuramate: L-alanyl-gamma-D-glutamyl-meso-diaminopimelate ligase